MGRQPKPTHLRIVENTLDGKHGKGRAKKRSREPAPKGYLAPEDCPEGFNDLEREIWRTALADAPYGLLRKLDGPLFGAWCIACATHAEAHRKLRATSAMIVKTPSGATMPNPYLSIMNRQTTLMKSLAAEFGFSPAARTRVALEEPEADDDSIARYFK